MGTNYPMGDDMIEIDCLLLAKLELRWQGAKLLSALLTLGATQN
jgi:hypothetical protein